MLYKFQPADIERIRENFDTHPLYCSFSNACKAYRLQTGSILLTPEEVFAQVAIIFDSLKEKQESSDFSHLWEDLFGDYQQINPNASNEEISNACIVIIAVVFISLYGSTPYLYHNIAKQIRGQIPLDYKQANTIIDDIIDHTDCEALSLWLDNYMQTDKFLSDTLKSYYAVEKTDNYTEHLFPYYNSIPSFESKKSIELALHQAAEKGATAIVKVLNANTAYIDLGVATDMDLYNEFHNNYSYTQTYDAINDAMKKFKGNRQLQ